MKKWKTNILPFLVLLLVPLVNGIYGFLNNGNGAVYSLVTDLDRAVPFLKVFVIPYMLWYPFLYGSLIFLCIKDRTKYYGATVSIVIGMLVSYLIYHIFQTTVPRPQISGSGFLNGALAFIYGNDQPFNCFPSIHVLTSFVIIKSTRDSKNINMGTKIFMTVLGIMIILSTQFIKQHVILDLVAALFLGSFLYKTINLINMEMRAIWDKKVYLLSMTKKKLET